MFGYNLRATKHSSPQTPSNTASLSQIFKVPAISSVSHKIKPG